MYHKCGKRIRNSITFKHKNLIFSNENDYFYYDVFCDSSPLTKEYSTKIISIAYISTLLLILEWNVDPIRECLYFDTDTNNNGTK